MKFINGLQPENTVANFYPGENLFVKFPMEMKIIVKSPMENIFSFFYFYLILIAQPSRYL
ncbi:unnamed protein product [marine sediment metagenome]|uniref:Uncharacterized protein n=1 Tax=marine sediment metagenome TaxID=412755 RepID=X1VIM0_9ZZZZ